MTLSSAREMLDQKTLSHPLNQRSRSARTDEECKHAMRQQVSSLLLQHKAQLTITEAEDWELSGIRKLKNIVTLPADKGRSTVVMDKTEYWSKLENLLMDKESYALSDVSEFKKLVNNINKTVGRLKKANALTRREALAAKATDTAMARFTACPRVEADEVMVSFDVVSLFTSIPPDLAIDTLDGLLREKYDETDQKLKRVHIIELLELCLKTFFTFKGQVYEQKGNTNGFTSVWTNCRSGLAEAGAAGLQLVPSEVLGQIC
ncbi:hypothetical protein SprV_0100432700 [Sparganum proliferum]